MTSLTITEEKILNFKRFPLILMYWRSTLKPAIDEYFPSIRGYSYTIFEDGAPRTFVKNIKGKYVPLIKIQITNEVLSIHEQQLDFYKFDQEFYFQNNLNYVGYASYFEVNYV